MVGISKKNACILPPLYTINSEYDISKQISKQEGCNALTRLFVHLANPSMHDAHWPYPCLICASVTTGQDPHAIARSIEALGANGGAGVRGIVVNRVSKSLLGGLYTSHHFYAIIPWAASAGEEGAAAVAGAGAAAAAGTTWYVIDSKAAKPEIIGKSLELALHLEMEARENQGHVFVVSDGSGEEGQAPGNGGG